MSDLKTRFENIFHAELAEEPLAQNIGLKVIFKGSADLTSVMARFKNQNTGGFIYKHADFCDLTEEFGVITFINATVSGTPNAHLTGSTAYDGLQTQDVFHRDPMDVVTFLFEPHLVKRDIPTLYAQADEVRKAIAAIDVTGLPDKAIQALEVMRESSYSFSIEGDEKKWRDIVRVKIPDFNDIIFNLIPADKKLCHNWESDNGEVVAHSNKLNRILHGRPRGHACKNRLMGMDISR